MRKTVVSTCAVAFLTASASTAFAAANPFEDVPADHWAYDAIAQLAVEGVIEGYGDGTYRGDQEITRYEMAQMIARAMAKGGGNKALIDKLAAEFADELNQLGVRVAALEKKVDNVKWNGTIRYRYYNNRKHETGEPLEKNTAQYLTLRLEPSLQINEHWSGHARIDYNSDMNSAANTTGATEIPLTDNPAEGPFVSGIRIERIWAQGDYKNSQILLGKLPYLTNIDNGMVYDDNVAGGQLTFGNKVKATITAGRSARYDSVGSWPDIRANNNPKTGSYVAAEIYNDRADKITWGVGFHRWAGSKETLYQSTSVSAVNIWDIGFGYKFDKNLSIQGAYAWTTNPSAELPEQPGDVPESVTAASKRAWSIELDYKKATPADKGSWGAFVAYRQLGAYAVIAPTYDAMQNRFKGVEMGVDYVFEKNIMGTLKYFFGKEEQDDYDMDDAPQSSAYTFFGELNFFF